MGASFGSEAVKEGTAHRGLPELSAHIVRGSSRVALALVTLGLYLAARWFTIRLVRAIGKKI